MLRHSPGTAPTRTHTNMLVMSCVDYIARLGALGYDCYMEEKQYSKEMCIIGGAVIVGSKSIGPRQSVNW